MEITNEQKDGVNMLGKILKKDFPYIVGAKLNEDTSFNYDTLIIFQLIINRKKIEFFFNDISSTNWKEFWSFRNLFHGDPDPDGKIVNDIREVSRMFYESLGDEYQFKKPWKDNSNKEITINSFVFDDEN